MAHPTDNPFVSHMVALFATMWEMSAVGLTEVTFTHGSASVRFCGERDLAFVGAVGAAGTDEVEFCTLTSEGIARCAVFFCDVVRYG